MRIATPVDADGNTAGAWGRAHWVAVAEVHEGAITDWEVHQVEWDRLHDTGTEGSHHARVASFLRLNDIQAVVLDHCGPGMTRMLLTMGIPQLPASPGDARQSVLTAVSNVG